MASALTYNQMVVHQQAHDEVDRIFHALADATRRDIIARVLRQEQSVSALAGAYAMSFAAIQKHVAVLERATLVVKHRRGREQVVQCNVHAIRDASRLLDQFEQLWRHRADQMSEILAEPSEPPTETTESEGMRA